MTPLTFTLKGTPQQRVDLSPLTPNLLAGRSRAEIEALELWSGNRKLRVAELFDVAGDDAAHMEFAGSIEKLDRIGAGMTQGQVTIRGDCGAYLGLAMSGGELEVRGNAGDFAASGMKGGLMRIQGNAGDFVGAALAGERRGMAGGTVIVSGDVGDRAGDFMRRGMLLVEGSTGSYCASRMLAGTIAILESVGSYPGYAMRRGTLLLFQALQERPATFNDCGEHVLGFLALLRQTWRKLGGKFSSIDRSANRVQRLMGDVANGGKGEILIWL